MKSATVAIDVDTANAIRSKLVFLQQVAMGFHEASQQGAIVPESFIGIGDCLQDTIKLLEEASEATEEDC